MSTIIKDGKIVNDNTRSQINFATQALNSLHEADSMYRKLITDLSNEGKDFSKAKQVLAKIEQVVRSARGLKIEQ